MRAVNAVVMSRMAQCAVVIHLCFAALALGQMNQLDEVGCAEAVAWTALDRPVGERLFLFNYSSDVTRALIVVDLPALSVGAVAVEVGDLLVGGFSYPTWAWANAVAFGVATTVQWALIGTLLATVVQRWHTLASRRPGVPPNYRLQRSARTRL